MFNLKILMFVFNNMPERILLRNMRKGVK